MMTMDVLLTDVGKAWLQDHYPQGNIWRYDFARALDKRRWLGVYVFISRTFSHRIGKFPPHTR